MATLLALEGAVAQGILYAIMTLGVYITYKLLDFADLTVDGSFALGGCVSAILITVGLDPFTSLLIATLAGMASGVITGFFNTVFKIPPILSGIYHHSKVDSDSDRSSCYFNRFGNCNTCHRIYVLVLWNRGGKRHSCNR